MADENFEEQHFGNVQNIGEQQFGDVQNIGEQQFGDVQNIGEQQFGDVQNIGEQQFGDVQNIGEQQFGDVQNIGEQQFGDVQNIGEQQFGDVQNIGEQQFGDIQNIDEQHLDDTQIIEEQHLDDTQIVDEQHLNATQVLEEQHLDDIQNIDEQHLDDAQNIDLPSIEEQQLGDVEEMDNIPGDSHPAEGEKQSENNSAVVEEEKKWPGWPGENVFRVLVPVQKVGGIIGRKGEFIKKMCEETKARIKILDGPPGITERAILISAKEEPNLLIPPAMEGLLQIHKRIVELDCDPANAASGVTVCTRLLVAASQAGSLIGKQGATVKSIQDDSHCNIRVLGGENLPVFALPDDSVVEVQGEPANMQKGVELVATHLRKFLVDRSVINVFEVQMQAPNSRGSQGIPPPQSWRHPPPSFPMSPSGAAGHGYDPFMAPPHQRPYDNYYPPVDMSFEKPPRSVPTAYGRGGAHTPNVQQPQQAVIAKVTHNLQIQLSFADAVIGVKGANISYIRRASGATIAIQEAQGVPDQMNVEINGSASQVQAAEQLIQNSIADARSSMQQNASGAAPPSQQAYNPYAPPHGAYDASAGGGHAPPPADYGSMYGGAANFGGY